jgi:hypothetical protein
VHADTPGGHGGMGAQVVMRNTYLRAYAPLQMAQETVIMAAQTAVAPKALAEELGLNASTVSRVLNDSAGIDSGASRDTKERSSPWPRRSGATARTCRWSAAVPAVSAAA